MSNNQQSPKYDFRGAQFAGGMAETVQGDQIGGTINNYEEDLSEIYQLLSALRKQIQTFPNQHRNKALGEISDLETELEQPIPDKNKLGRRLKSLIAIASTASIITGSAAAFSGNLNDFVSNIGELAEVLELPFESVRPALPKLIDE